MSLASTVNLNGSTPAPASGQQNIAFADDAGSPTVNISATDPPMVGDTGTGGTGGNVPAPPSGSAAAGKFLKADGTWAVPSGAAGTFTQEVVAFSGTAGTLAHTPISGGFFALFRNGMLMIPTGSSVQSYSITGASVTISVAAGSGDAFYALYNR